MKEIIIRKFKKINKKIIAILIASNLLIVATGAAELNLLTATPSAEQLSSSSAIAPQTELSSDSALLTENVTPITQVNSVKEKLKNFDSDKKVILDEIVVRYRSDVNEDEKTNIAAENETRIEKDLPNAKLKILKVKPEKRDEIINKLKNNPKVEYAGPNYPTGISEYFGGGGGGGTTTTPNDPKYTAQSNLTTILAPLVWNYYKGSSSVKVAVVDTGINYYLTSGNEMSLVENGGRIIKGRDAYNNDNDPLDDNGHGTQVASVIGAKTNNGTDIAAIDWYSQLIAVKVLASDGTGGTAELAEGLEWLYNNNPLGLKVINLSLWMGNDDPNVRNAINNLINRGILVVVGVYNSTPGNYNCDTRWPAKYPGVLAVVASDGNNHYSGCTSNLGHSFLMAAPGKYIWTVYGSGGTIQSSGTSYAAPHVSGAASVFFSCGTTTMSDIKYALIQGADDIGAAGFDSAFGWGRLNMNRSMTQVNSC